MREDFAVLRRLAAFARPHRWMLLASILIGSITVLASFSLMAIAGWFIASMAIAGATTGMMNYFAPAAGIRFFAILRTAGRYLDRLVSHEATFRLLASLRLWLFRRMEPLAPAGLEDSRGADLAGRIQGDVDTLQHAYLRLGAPVVTALLSGIVIVAVLGFLHPPSALAVGVFLFCAGAAMPLAMRRLSAAPGAEAVRLRADMRVAVVDFLQGATDLRTAGATSRSLAAIDGTSRALAEAQRRAANAGALAEAAVGLFAGLAMWCVALLAIAGVAGGSLTPAMAPALTLAALAAFEAVAPLPAAVQRLGEILAAARRLFEIADRRPELALVPGPSPVPLDDGLVFSNVRLRYAADAPPALDGLDLDVPAGSRVAILGPSGAGKSSIAELLLRFRPFEGEIRLGGHDLSLYRGEDLRRLVGVAAQKAHLFNTTIRDNLAIAAPEADEAAMMRALAVAQLADLVEALPEGLDSWIGEGGTRLSAGEARRLVIARTLLREPRILVLDEPTENLDRATAARLLAAIREATPGRTTLLITHDPAAASAFAHMTVRLENGHLTSNGGVANCFWNEHDAESCNPPIPE